MSALLLPVSLVFGTLMLLREEKSPQTEVGTGAPSTPDSEETFPLESIEEKELPDGTFARYFTKPTVETIDRFTNGMQLEPAEIEGGSPFPVFRLVPAQQILGITTKQAVEQAKEAGLCTMASLSLVTSKGDWLLVFVPPEARSVAGPGGKLAILFDCPEPPTVVPSAPPKKRVRNGIVKPASNGQSEPQTPPVEDQIQ